MVAAADLAEAVRGALLGLAVLLVFAKIGGELMARLGQPPVLGELLAGVILGNLGLVGITALDPLRDSGLLRIAGEIGAVLLLFHVGVESDLKELLSVGWSSLVVAALGVTASVGLAFATSVWLLPGSSWLTHLFVSGTIAPTSVGITARVLKDLGKSSTKEGRIILGAAIVDDVLGLVVLAVVSGLVGAAAGSGSAGVDWSALGWITLKAVLFLVAAAVVGRFWASWGLTHAARLKSDGSLLAACVCFCFLMAGAAALAGLAPIVGAFAAGVVLEEGATKPFLARGERTLEELLVPITALMVPLFFVAIGMRVDLRAAASPEILKFAGAVAAAAVLAKQICGLGVLERRVNRLAIGAGMIPRGEVSLIFAGIGGSALINGSPVLTPGVFSGLVLVVLLTTLLTPSLLKLAFEKR
jgi:Kef-type K+ transport system membrane component KefB